VNTHLSSALGRLIEGARAVMPDLRFEMLEIGAVPLGGSPEPFHRLLYDFPGSRIHAFELDPSSCERLRRLALSGVEIHEVAIGRRRERRVVHLTNHPMCSSLYRPNDAWLECFHNLEVSYLRDTTEVETMSIDDFTTEAGIPRVDFVKIDIQGAELDAFQGGAESLEDCLAIVTEVEFLELYENQPLFGDVDRELRSQGFMFHKFLGLAGRAMRPLLIGNDPNAASWHLWSDAMYVRSFEEWSEMDPAALIRLGLLALLYGSPDITCQCLMIADDRLGSKLLATMNPT